MGRFNPHTALYAMAASLRHTRSQLRHLRRHREPVPHCRRNALPRHQSHPRLGTWQPIERSPLQRQQLHPRDTARRLTLHHRFSTEARQGTLRERRPRPPHRGRTMESHPHPQARGPRARYLRFSPCRPQHNESPGVHRQRSRQLLPPYLAGSHQRRRKDKEQLPSRIHRLVRHRPIHQTSKELQEIRREYDPRRAPPLHSRRHPRSHQLVQGQKERNLRRLATVQ